MTEATQIVPGADINVQTEKFEFRFKKDKLGNKRDNLELEVPVPNLSGLVDIIEKGGKGLFLLQDAVSDVIRAAVASWVAETDADKASQATLPLNQLTWDFIANQDKKDRRSVTISDEAWTAFGQDYVAVMKRVQPSKTDEMLANAVKVYLAKFAMFKGDKATLQKMKAQLAIYIENTENGEDHSDILELLTRRLENYLAADDVAALAAAL